MSPSDFEKYKDYYRDILKEYSPAELSYVDDFEINNNRELTATILNLKLKNKIEIENDKIIVIDENLDNLRLSEKFIMQRIVEGQIYIPYKEKDKIRLEFGKQEAILDGLILKSEVKIPKKDVIFAILKAIGMFILVILINYVYFKFLFDAEKTNGGIAVFLLFFDSISFFAIPGYNHSYLLYKSKIHRRTNLGEEINTKLDGLRNYIADYSLLKEKDQKYLELWDEYLIYSIILDVNKKSNLVKNLMNLVHIEQADFSEFEKLESDYDNLIRKYSLAELAFFRNNEITNRNLIALVIFQLELKNKITINNGQINIVDTSIINLRPEEQYILQNITNEKIYVKNEEFKMIKRKYIYNKSIEDDLLIRKIQQGEVIYEKTLIGEELFKKLKILEECILYFNTLNPEKKRYINNWGNYPIYSAFFEAKENRIIREIEDKVCLI